MAFTFKNSKEEFGELPLLIGLGGPSGGGKTYSGLRLAAGIQRVRGGKIVGIDSEARRMLHYRNQFDFQHLEFQAPFGSLRYLEAINAAVDEAQGGVVFVDSMSHEHEGEGGYLEFHEKELDRLAGNDYAKRERMKFLAWVKPSGERRRLINTILQKKCAFLFGFRAKEKLKLVKGQDPVSLGWQPIAGEEFWFEMTLRCLLPPGANGIPDWSQEAFKNLAAKRSDHHVSLIPDGQQLTEEIGERFALWARGQKILMLSEEQKAAAKKKAGEGAVAMRAYWNGLTPEEKKAFGSMLPDLQRIAADADAAKAQATQSNTVEI